jgi:ABC-type transport system involved in multi-copper enzyme maturation permease subunit
VTQIWASIRTNLKLYRRNRLLLGAAILLVILVVLMSSNVFFYTTDLDLFSIVSRLFDAGHWILYLFVGATGLITVSEPYDERSLKMVLTRPIPHEKWLLSHFLTAFGLAVVLHGGLGVATWVVSYFLGVTYYSGFWFLTLNWIPRTMILFSVLLTLSLYMRPILAAFLTLVINPSVILRFAVQAMATASASSTLGDPNMWLNAGSYGLMGLYLLLPVYDPMAEQLSTVKMRYQLETAGEWWYLLPSSGYALLVVALCYCFVLFVLRNRNLS